MAENLNKNYEPKESEARLYKYWTDNGFFKGHVDRDKKPFTIVMPPPNITGQLHMGHALDNMMQDAIIRFKRMQGYAALWVPGTDHASIATEVKIVNQLAESGIKKEDLGREGFLKKAWEWREQYGGRIVEQLKKLGSSCDWSRERFTMDEGCSRAVKEVFVRLYEKGLIYRGSRIINWCPKCQTALSDAEVEYSEQPSHLWHIRYEAEDGGEGVVVATTRPETMLGDTAVAVNPNDERYKDLVGKNVILPLVNKAIPVVADEYVDVEFGTGAVKITPAHDPNDFEVASRHDLEIIKVLNDDGSINENGGKYEGLDRMEARDRIVEDLKSIGALVKIEDYTHNVGCCYRCGTTVEPIVSLQWFVSMKELAKPAIEAVESGETKFVPSRFSKIYYNWMNNIRDWCISRQLWWGHRIPAYYCDECGELVVTAGVPGACPKCGCTSFHQDEDVLDTWFSSGLWPFSTLGWPEKTDDLDFFYPTSVLVTGYDIIFFWVARMIVFGCEVMGKSPFAHIAVHGIVRDSQGRKMSKSLNNGIDPLEVIDKYGADALRFSLAMGNKPGNDMRYYDSKVEACRNFANKIWNASRFVLMNLDCDIKPIDEVELDISDKWILERLNEAVSDITDLMENYDLGIAAQRIYDFAWNELCDWYIEMAKPSLYDAGAEAKQNKLSVLVHVIIDTLKLLHPFMPFITEEIYLHMPGAGTTIMLSDYPVKKELAYKDDAIAMQDVMDLIHNIRNLRAEMNVAPSMKTNIIVRTGNPDMVNACADYFRRLAYASDVTVVGKDYETPKGCVSAISVNSEAFLPLAELVDIEKETARLKGELDRLTGEIKRAEGKLSNESFVSKAPENVVNAEREKLANYIDMKDKVQEKLDSISRIAEN